MVKKYNEIDWTDLGDGLKRKILAAEGKMMSVEVSFKKDAVGAVHSHPHEQISYILEGSFQFELDGKKTTLVKGDTFYVAPDKPHGVVALVEGSRILDTFSPQREDFLN